MYWKDIQAVLERSLVINCSMQTLESREMGHYQEPTAVITGPNSLLDGQHCAEFYQTIHYGTVRKRGNMSSVAKFYSNDADKHPNLHVGVAQCAIPYQNFCPKENYLDQQALSLNYLVVRKR